MERITRKKFLKTMGTVVAGGALTSVSAMVISRNLKNGSLRLADDAARHCEQPSRHCERSEAISSTEDCFVPRNDASASRNCERSEAISSSAYKQVATITFDGAPIDAFDVYDGKVYALANNSVVIASLAGKTLSRFPVKEALVRDMAVASDGVYILRPASVQVYSFDGALLREWTACSELSDYCSFTLADYYLFITDKDNKVLHQYTRGGEFVRFVNSPNRFIIPSLTYGITYANGKIYCSNSGRHQVEIYSLEGKYEGAFGKAGGAAGYFCGCCNPAHLTATTSGEIITSEKGSPRISCYGADGAFRSVLLDAQTMGGGTVAYEPKISGDKLLTASKSAISVYAYNPITATAATACSACGLPCPLKVAL